MPHSLKLIIKCRLSDKKWLLILIKQMELSEFPTDAISAFTLVLTPKSANRKLHFFVPFNFRVYSFLPVLQIRTKFTNTL